MKIVETPRDGFQGLEQFIPTENKIRYINQLLKVGFDTVEVGSFVSKRAIPQMKDTAKVIKGLDLESVKSKIMVLVGNVERGKEAMQFEEIDQILYPFSVSPTFLKKNLNSNFDKAKGTINELLDLCDKHNKEMIVYLTMGFGNPYGDPWHPEIVGEWVSFLYNLHRRIIPLSDIMGNVTPEIITSVYNRLIPAFPDVEFGIHLHVRPGQWYEKVDAAYRCGVLLFDTVLGGFGGCPMTDDELVSNLNTLDLVSYCNKQGIEHSLSLGEMKKALEINFKL